MVCREVLSFLGESSIVSSIYSCTILLCHLLLSPPFIGSEYSVSFCEQLVDITRYSKFQDVATLFYGDLPVTSGSSIVSSIEFDKDGDFFAVGGVTRKIKVCSLA